MIDSDFPGRLVPEVLPRAQRPSESSRARTRTHTPLLHELFESTVERHPLRTAVQSGHHSLSYRELEQRANQLAHHLRARGVVRGDHVGIYLPRGVNIYVAMLAILKAGAAYVPLDSECPAERILEIGRVAQMKLLVSLQAMAAPLVAPASFAFVCIDVDAPSIARQPTSRIAQVVTGVCADDPCYAIFTSGSTGVPKGVSIAHRSAAHVVRAEAEAFGPREDDRVFQGFSCAFDASLEEIWLAFCSGAALISGSQDDMRSGPELPARLSALGVTVLSTVPTLLATFAQPIPTLRLLILGGEACPQDLAERWTGPGLRVVNTYGPTETTVVATYAELRAGHAVTIGGPLPGYYTYVLDAALREVPDGQSGELCIAGIGVARGYLGRDDLTAERFPANPYATDADNTRLYRTGDLVRKNSHGQLEFLGRIDEQIKLRGFRIELGEIEAKLRQVPEIAAGAVTVQRADALERLVAHVVLRPGHTLDPQAVRRALAAQLPSYMVPSVVQAIASIPTLPSGKVNKQALVAPPLLVPSALALDPQLSARERRLLTLWTRLLQTEVQLDDDFFALGGQSLLAATMVSELRREPDFADLSVSDVYRHATVRDLSAALARAPLQKRPQEQSRGAPVTRAGRAAYVVGQLLALHPVILFSALEWLTPYVVYGVMQRRGLPAGTSIGLAFLSLLALYPMLFLIALSSKWLLLGRMRPGEHRLWSFYHLRFWVASRLIAVAPTARLVGTPWLGLYLRMMGAKIGREVHLAADAVHAFDLLQIGDHSSIGPDVRLHGYAIEDGWLRLGVIEVGARCYIGTRSVLAPGTRLGDDSSLGPLSLLRSGDAVPAGEHWQGAPACPARGADVSDARLPGPLQSPTRGSKLLASGAYLVGGIVVSAFQLIAMLPGLAVLQALSEGGATFAAQMLAALLAAPLFVLSLALQIAALKWVVLGRVRPGCYPIHGAFYVRKWFVDQLMELSLDSLGPLYATLYLNPWFRLLGARIGVRAELSTAGASTPDLLTLEEESFVADAVSLGTARFDRGMMELAPTRIGSRAFVGNSAVVAGGTALGERSLVGVLSVPPALASEARRNDASWLGSPAFELRHRSHSEAFDEETTYQPGAGLYALRLFVEYFRITLPATVFVLLASLLLATLSSLSLTCGLLEAVLLFPFVYLAFSIAAASVVVLAKWSLIGRYRAGERPLWSGWVFRNELVTSLHENLAAPWLLDWAEGTPLAPMFFRLLGARIGKWTTMNSTWLTEYDLIDIGDEVCLDQDCTLQTHLFEDRVMKMSSVTLERGVSVGVDAVVLYDARMESGALLGPLSLLMKGETLPANTRWSGIPAQRD